MPHKPGAEHAAWAAKKKEQAEKRKKLKEKKKSTNKSSSKDKSFVLNKKMRAALCTQAQMSGEEIDKILQQDF